MAIIKSSKLREMSAADIEEKVRELKLELSKEIGFSEIGTVKNPGHVGELRKTIARLLAKKSEIERKNVSGSRPAKTQSIK